MHLSALVACRLLIQRYKLDTSEQVYPSDEKGSFVDPKDGSRWYNLADWMKETSPTSFNDVG